MGLAWGFAIGLALGAVLAQSDFCMHSALRDVVARRAGPSVRMWLVALAVQLLVVNALAGAGVLSTPLPPVMPAAAAAGGLIFGVGMVLAKG